MSALALTISLSPACLVPQSDDVLPGEPTFLNQPPYFNNVTPSYPYIEATVGPGCPPLEFTVTVADPNVLDAVRLRFYVDFDLTTRQGFEREVLLTISGEPQRPDVVTYRVAMDGSSTSQLAQPSAQPHIVEAVAFDGTLSPERLPEPFPTPPDAGTNPSFATIRQWVVLTQSGTCVE